MKSLIVFLISMIAWAASLYAQPHQTEEREIPLQVIKEMPNETRSVVILPVHAYIGNEIITVTFQKSYSTATLTVINKRTGETVYTETACNPVQLSIDLNNENSGDYCIEITVDGTLLIGEFYLQ